MLFLSLLHIIIRLIDRKDGVLTGSVIGGSAQEE